MSDSTQSVEADRALKARHREMWALGDYPATAIQIIPDLGVALVQACGIGPGDRVLDVAAGSGNAAIPAALAGARVIASDLTPQLLEAGKVAAASKGLELEWREADAEALPFTDGEFDVVMSCVGVMFAPHHKESAAEMVRVCRPGGTIGVLSWTPTGFVGQMLATMKPYAPPPPAGTLPPPLWGDKDHVLALLGDVVTDVHLQVQTLPVERFATPDQFLDYYKANYGPTINAYRAIAGDPEKVGSLDRDLTELVARHQTESGSPTIEFEYLLVTARKRG